jgi:hypothetical protein
VKQASTLDVRAPMTGVADWGLVVATRGLLRVMLLTEPTYNRTRVNRARLAGEESKPEGTTQAITLLDGSALDGSGTRGMRKSARHAGRRIRE